MRDNETLQLIENFVSKAENVLQTKVSQINSLQNKVDLLNAKDDMETTASDSETRNSEAEETNSISNKNIYATFKSSQMIKEHIEQHLKDKERQRTTSAEIISSVS